MNATNEIQDLKNENKSLREQLVALQFQMNALQVRIFELQKQNTQMQKNLLKMEKSKKELEELQLQKDELFTLIIHDIKNPVSIIKQLVELLSSYDLTASEQQKIIKDISITTSKIVMLSQEVSKIMTIEAKQLTLRREEININDLVQDIYQRNLISAKNKSIKFIAENNENLPTVILDVQKTDEIIDNLVSNAIKFTQKGGTVILKAEVEDGNLKVAVSDNGLGISEEDIKQAFKLGSKLSNKPTGEESSTGLGLWIVKKLVDIQNGKVWVKSALGKGSTFYFTLPISE